MSLVGRETLVAPDDTWSLLMVMCVAVAVSIYLEQKYMWASKISGAIIALLFALVLSNLSIIPTACTCMMTLSGALQFPWVFRC